GEVGRGSFKGDLQRVVVDGLDAELVDGQLAFGDFFGVLDRVEGGDVLGGRLRVEDARPGIDEVVGVEGSAIGPGDALADVEGVFGRVGIDVPTLGDAGDDLAGPLIDADETVEDVEEDGQFFVAVADARIHGRRFLGGKAHDLVRRQIAAVGRPLFG